MEAQGPHLYTLVFLHSCHGRPCHVEPLVRSLQERGLTERHLRVVAPGAPRRPCEHWGSGSLQWFEYLTDTLRHGRAAQDAAHRGHLREQRARLLRLLERELGGLPGDGRLVLSGLSQGASVALDLLLHLPRPLAGRLRGVCLRRGMLQRESLEAAEGRAGGLGGLPVLATHGTQDELVPCGAARRSYEPLEGLGAALRFRTLSGLRHNGEDARELEAIADFLRRCFHGP